MKKNVKVILAVVGLVVVGGIVALSVGKPNGIKVIDGPKYQYQVINPDDIIVEYSGLKPDKKLSDYDGNYVTDTSVYLSDTVGIYLGEEHFEAKVGEYVNYVDVSFKWNVSDKDLYLLSRRQLEASPSLFEGSITYADGFVGSIDADEVELKQEGDKLKVYITFRGDESVGYEIVIPEMWEDLNLNEESQEDVEAWYEGLGGDSSQVDDSAMSGSVNEIHDEWNAINVSDLSSDSFHNKYLKMQELYKLFRSAVTSNNSDEISEGINNGTIKMEGCIAFKYELDENSEWVKAYGNSTLSEVFIAHGLPDYGVYGMCYCHTGSNKAIAEASSILGMSEDEFKKLTRTFIAQIPISAHERGNLSGEELIAYILEVLKDINNCDSDEEIFVDSDVAAAMYGISYDEVLLNYDYNLYGDYIYVGGASMHPTIVTMDDVYRVYVHAKEECGYSEGIVSWLKLSSSDIQKWVLNIYMSRCESANWQGIPKDTANFIVKLGGSLPSNITYEGETTGESTVESAN